MPLVFTKRLTSPALCLSHWWRTHCLDWGIYPHLRALVSSGLCPGRVKRMVAGADQRPAWHCARARKRARKLALSAQCGFKRYLIPSGVFALAYFSLGFILLKAHAVGFGVADIVLLYALFNVTCVVAAPLIGRLGDQGGAEIVFCCWDMACTQRSIYGWRWRAAAGMVAIFGIYGLFYAIDESQSKALIADIEPERRATAVGIYNFVTGLMYLPASLVAGALWTVFSSCIFQ